MILWSWGNHTDKTLKLDARGLPRLALLLPGNCQAMGDQSLWLSGPVSLPRHPEPPRKGSGALLFVRQACLGCCYFRCFGWVFAGTVPTFSLSSFRSSSSNPASKIPTASPPQLKTKGCTSLYSHHSQDSCSCLRLHFPALCNKLFQHPDPTML